jgi:hypothetical protein
MVEWLALGLVILGACTMVGAVVLANIVFFRYPLALAPGRGAKG